MSEPIPLPSRQVTITEADIDAGTPITEDLGARLFAAQFEGQLAYCHDQGKWFEFDGAIWRALRTPLAFHYARELARRLSARSSSVSTIQKTRFAAGVEQFSRADPVFARTADFWDADPFLMGVPGGAVDLTTGNLRQAEPSDSLTRSTAVAPLSWPDCPLWLEFLREATGDDEDLVRFLQQICGYALTGDTREHALFFMYGPGGNGKSVFINTISNIIGAYAMTATMDTFAQKRHSSIPSDIAMMRGARLVTASETAEGEKWDQQRIAQLTGGDAITARFLRQEFFTFKPQFSLFIIGNHKPSLTSVDEAMRRRFNIIPFLVKPIFPDLDLEKRLQAEWPAILRWMIDGCLDWQANGLIRPQSVLDATQDYFDDQNTMQQWLDQDCDVDMRNHNLVASSGSLFTSWSRYARGAGDIPGDAKSFKSSMEKLGFKFKRDKTGRWFYFVQLKPIEYDHQ